MVEGATTSCKSHGWGSDSGWRGRTFSSLYCCDLLRADIEVWASLSRVATTSSDVSRLAETRSRLWRDLEVCQHQEAAGPICSETGLAQTVSKGHSEQLELAPDPPCSAHVICLLIRNFLLK